MALTTLSVKTTFNRVTGKIVIEDTTDYVAQGVDVSTDGLEGYLSVTYNIGSGEIVLYNNIGGSTPDISPATSLISSADIDIPLANDGITPLPAEYTVTYNVISAILSADVTAVTQYTYSLVDTSIAIQSQVNCLTSSITSTDVTDYTSDGCTIESIVRAHTLFPPPASGQTVMGPLNLESLVYSPISTTTWTSQVISTVTYLQSDGLYISVQFTGSKEFQATCDVNLSKIVCCLINLDNEYESLESTNTVKAASFKSLTIEPTMRHLTLFLAAQSAGNYDKMTSEYQKILNASHCTEDCGCNDDGPTIVQVLSAGSSVCVVDSPSGNIAVTSEVIGDTTYYHLNLSTALLTILSNVVQYTADTTTPSYISVTTSGTNPKNFRINYVGPTPNQAGLMVRDLVVYKNTGVGNNYLLDNAAVSTYGLRFTGSETMYLGQSNVALSTDIACVKVTGFFDPTDYPVPSEYTVHAQVERSADALSYTAAKQVECEVLWKDPTNASGSFVLRLYDPTTGTPYTFADLDTLLGTTGVYISLTVSTTAS